MGGQGGPCRNYGVTMEYSYARKLLWDFCCSQVLQVVFVILCFVFVAAPNLDDVLLSTSCVYI